jgi:hypothetical protein
MLLRVLTMLLRVLIMLLRVLIMPLTGLIMPQTVLIMPRTAARRYEETNLFLIQNSQETEETLDQLNAKLAEADEQVGPAPQRLQPSDCAEPRRKRVETAAQPRGAALCRCALSLSSSRSRSSISTTKYASRCAPLWHGAL